MARPIWKGHISFGLVNVPVELQSAEERSEMHFHLLDRRDHNPIKYQRVNEQTGEQVAWQDIVKGYKYDDGKYVIVTDEDFKRAAVEATQTIDIECFVDREAIAPVYFDRPYYLTPTAKGEKGYLLLREALSRTDKVGIAKVVLRSRQYLAALMVYEDALMLNLLRFAEELRDVKDLKIPSKSEKAQVTAKETALAEELIKSMVQEWRPEDFHDQYRDALMKWIDRKIQAGGRDISAETKEPAKERGPKVISIVDLLTRSVESRKAQKPAASRRNTSTPRRRAKSA